MSIEVYVNNIRVNYNVFNFNGGEVSVKLDLHGYPRSNIGFVTIRAFLKNPQDILELIFVKNAIEQKGNIDKNCEWILQLPYIPYARQDRVCDTGEAFTLKEFASKFINPLNFDKVIVEDPHSDVSASLIDNVVIIPQHELVIEQLAWRIRYNNMALVSPDAGALKKVYKLAKSMGGLDVFKADKLRDTTTGEIIATEVHETDFKGRDLLIVDDIFDAGGTFLALAKELKARNAGQVELYVTHGIFARGVDIAAGLIDAIYARNIWEENIQNRNTKGILKTKVSI